jgi:squalene-hopene/tetraprenyl-beta-curcumene cyclase
MLFDHSVPRYLLLAILCMAGVLAACTTRTTVVDETKLWKGRMPGEERNQPGASPGGEDPLADLAPEWQSKGAAYLDARVDTWLTTPNPIKTTAKCAMTCHTTFSYLLARSSFAGHAKTSAADRARAELEARVAAGTAGTALPFYGSQADQKGKESHATESVLNAAALALDDVNSGHDLSASSKSALERMWTLQRSDGTWDWLEFGLEPWETRNDFGAALAALVTGSIPENATPKQAAGTTKVVSYLQKRLTATSDTIVLHDRTVVLWASGSLKTLLQPGQADAIARELVATQLADGGFSLGAWGRGELASDVKTKSDGYATGLAILALCKGTPEGTKRADVKKGLAWLAKHQAQDGSWPGQSVNSTSSRANGFMTDAATAYATLALTSCASPK